ncbi:MAG TPA: hypothetical protein VMW83_16570 [Spirochaetia bacterium]|nr:hypothetical protein [Spirochaetia bacterium]
MYGTAPGTITGGTVPDPSRVTDQGFDADLDWCIYDISGIDKIVRQGGRAGEFPAASGGLTEAAR